MDLSNIRIVYRLMLSNVFSKIIITKHLVWLEKLSKSITMFRADIPLSWLKGGGEYDDER